MADKHLTRPLPPLLLMLALLTALAGCTRAPATTESGLPLQRVVLAGETFHLEIAADDAARIQGLSDRPYIPADGGMLFVFPDAAPRTFVMRRCLVPIDILYLSPRGRIVSMHAMEVEPYDTPESQLRRYPSSWPAQFAIEVAGGTINRLGLRPGQQVDLPLDQLKAMAR
jgi:uncharacterized membrane protein (UPF0127 family)